jgi:hypothetical protein
MRNAILLLLVSTVARAATIPVAPGASIQSAIVAAQDGDVVEVAAGTFVEDLDFLGKAIAVRGEGPSTVVRGTGTGPVVRFTSGEGAASVLDGVTITGGVAEQGGGILVVDASPTVQRTIVAENAARRQGSGIYLERSASLVTNNLFVGNRAVDPNAGDPHTVQTTDSPVQLVNNTIAYGDSNGLLIRGGGDAVVVRNNVFAANGARVAGEVRGRGICDFSRGAVIQYNLFHRNRRAALLSGTGDDYRRVRQAERAIGDPRLAFNVDGAPRFASPRRGEFDLAARSRARDAGDPSPMSVDPDGSRNDIGATGGPLAPAWRLVIPTF